MVGHIDRVELSGVTHALGDAANEMIDQRAFDRPRRMAAGQENGHWLPWARCVHGPDESANLRRQGRLAGPSLVYDLLSFKPVKCTKVVFAGRRGLSVALQDYANDRDAWPAPL